jgi:hypothetical protein
MEISKGVLKTYNLSEAIELMRNGHCVREVDWENREIQDGDGKSYIVYDYLKLLETCLVWETKPKNIIDQPYIAKFYYNAGWMPTPYIPTSYEMMAGEFVIIDIKDVIKEVVKKENSEKENIVNDYVVNPIGKLNGIIIENFNNTKFYHKSIIGFLSIRKEIEVIGKASYIFISDDFEITINIIEQENVVGLEINQTKEFNKINIEISKSLLINSSDDFLLYYFMWLWFNNFQNHHLNPFKDKSDDMFLLADELAFSFMIKEYENPKLDNIINDLYNLFSKKGTININTKQKQRIERLANKCLEVDNTFHLKNKNNQDNSKEENISEELNLSPLEIVLNKFDELSKEEFSVWLDCQRDDLLLLENEYIGNAIKEYIKSNQKK